VTVDAERRLLNALAGSPHRVIACSGGVDSLLLADYAHQQAPSDTLVVHSVTPAVPQAATDRVVAAARELGWRLELVRSAEFDDERYLSNPVNRCFYCKTNLYTEIERIVTHLGDVAATTVMSGANTDDLAEYRPGLEAAAHHSVEHPYVEASLAKSDIRRLAERRSRSWHDLPAAPCLASRLYTGTRVTAPVLHAIEQGEALIRRRTPVQVVRCRVRGRQVSVEVSEDDRKHIDPGMLAEVKVLMRAAAPELEDVFLDDHAYAPGRAFVHIERPA
jgi:pyridinium-3,5-biscarboxylic acid mononucleotide sulfurtransferase